MDRELEDAVATRANSRFKRAALPAGRALKFAPLIVIEVPAGPMEGVNEEMLGAWDPTVKVVGLVADPPGAVSVMEPVVAPGGTVTSSSVVVADVTVPATPLNLTVFCDGVALKPLPWIATDVPTGPASGVTSRIAVVDAVRRVMPVIFPAGSSP